VRKFRILKFFVLVAIFVFVVFFVVGNLSQAQSQAKGKPDKPPGKPKPEPKPCNNNGICEYEEYDSNSDSEDQPCADCLPKTYPPLMIDQDFLQIASKGWVENNVFQFKCIGIDDFNGDTVGIYEDAWASDDIGISGRVVSIGDADNDGNKEIIAIVNYRVKGRKYDQKVFIFEAGSDGSPSWISPFFGNPSKDRIRDCAIGDADNDGNNEVILIKGHHIEIYRINYDYGDGSYAFSHVWTSPEHESDIAHNVYGLDVGDADNDEYNEIVLAMFETGAPIIWKKEGETWISNTADSVPLEYWDPDISTLGIDVVRVRDADNVINESGERDNEIIAGGNNSRLMVWKYNDDTGHYELVFISDDLFGLTQGVDAGDIDGDGENEIAIASSYEDNLLYLFKYLGAGVGYQRVYSIPREGPEIGLSVGDLDGDGKAEIISTTQGITIYEFIGPDIFSGYLMKTYNCAFGSYLEID